MPVVARDFVSQNFDSGSYVEVSIYVRAPAGSAIDEAKVRAAIQTASQSVSSDAITLPAVDSTVTDTPLDRTQLQGAGTPAGDGVAPADVNTVIEAKATAAQANKSTVEPETPAKTS